jgi:hypothetical protein
MSSVELVSIESKIAQLPKDDQLLLIERLAHRLRKPNALDDQVMEKELAAMAADPEIRREIEAINEEFAGSESDGLENL